MVVVSHQIQDILHRDHGIRYSLDETLHDNFFYNKRLITKKTCIQTDREGMGSQG